MQNLQLLSMNFFRLTPILIIIIPFWLFFSLGELVSRQSPTVSIAAQQSFESVGTKNTYPLQTAKITNKAFVNNEFIAYVNEKGSILHKRFLPAKSSIFAGTCCYLVHEKKTKSHSLYNSIGERLFEIEQPGYPILSSDGSRIVFVSTDGSSITLMDRTQKMHLSNFFFDSRITTLKFSPTDNYFLIGSTSGKLAYFNFFGQRLFQTVLDEHEYPIIKAVAINTKKPTMLLALSGHEPETLVLLTNTAKTLPLKIEKKWEVPTKDSETKPVAIYIDKENSFAVKQNNTGFKRFSLANGQFEDAFNILTLSQSANNYNANDGSSIKNSIYKSAHNFFVAGIVTERFSYLLLFSAKDLKIVWQHTFKTESITNLEISENDTQLFIVVHTDQQIVQYLLEGINP